MANLPPTYLVICLHEACPQGAAQYLADRLTEEAGLLVRQVRGLNVGC